MDRWDRMKQIFELLDYDSLTVRELFNSLNKNNENVSLNLVDALLRHYFKFGYLKRTRNPLKDYKYAYSLSRKGRNQLNWLNSDGYLGYIGDYEQKSNLNE